jgi:hypothetical protein
MATAPKTKAKRPKQQSSKAAEAKPTPAPEAPPKRSETSAAGKRFRKAAPRNPFTAGKDVPWRKR